MDSSAQLFQVNPLEGLPIEARLAQERLSFQTLYTVVMEYWQAQEDLFLGGALGAHLLASDARNQEDEAEGENVAKSDDNAKAGMGTAIDNTMDEGGKKWDAPNHHDRRRKRHGRRRGRNEGGSLPASASDPTSWSLEDFRLDLFSENFLPHANELANRLDSTLRQPEVIRRLGSSCHVVVLRTLIPYAKCAISVDMRPFCTFHSLPRGFSQLFAAKETAAPRLLPVEAHVVELCRTLYQPKAEEWSAALARLSSLLGASALRLRGGADEQDDPGPHRLRQRVFEALAANGSSRELILVGEYAIHLLAGRPLRYRSVLQLLSLNPAEDAEWIRSLVGGTVSGPVPVPIMQDFQLTRTTVRSSGADVVHLYNTLQYELVGYLDALPAKSTTVPRLGSFFLLVRFLFLDYWQLRLLRQDGRLQEAFFQTRERDLQESLDALQRCHSLPLAFPPPDHYLGLALSDEAFAKTVKSQEENRVYGDYYPHRVLAADGRYRQLPFKK